MDSCLRFCTRSPKAVGRLLPDDQGRNGLSRRYSTIPVSGLLQVPWRCENLSVDSRRLYGNVCDLDTLFGYLLVDNSTHIIVPECVLSLSQHSAAINDVFDGFIEIST